MNPRYSPYYTYIAPVIKNPVFKSVAPYIFSLSTITIFIIFAIRPTISTILNLQKSIDNNTVVLNALNKKVKDLSVAKNNYNLLSRETKLKIIGLVPSEPNISTLITSLQSSNIASVSALQIQPVNLYTQTNTPSINTLSEIEFSVNIQGSYPQFTSTLERLLKSPRLISINSININRAASSSSLMTITGKAYFLP